MHMFNSFVHAIDIFTAAGRESAKCDPLFVVALWCLWTAPCSCGGCLNSEHLKMTIRTVVASVQFSYQANGSVQKHSCHKVVANV